MNGGTNITTLFWILVAVSGFCFVIVLKENKSLSSTVLAIDEAIETVVEDESNVTTSTRTRHLDHDCFEPFNEPMMGVHDLSRILNVQFPKCGSSSLQYFFKDDFYTRHLH